MQYSIETRLNALQQIAEKKLINILESIPGQKDFIIDPDLIRPLEKVIGVSKLRSHGIDKIYKMEKSGVPATNKQRVYLVPSDLITAKHVCDQINSDIVGSSKNATASLTSSPTHNKTKTVPSSQQFQKYDINYHVILVPRKLQIVVDLFEEEGIIGECKLYSFKMEPLLLDNNILSDEINSLYRMLFIDGDQSYLPVVAKSLWTLQMLFGRPKTTIMLGKYSQLVCNMIDSYCESVSIPDRLDSDINSFIVVDRDVDYPSCLLTPGTYTGLLDEVFKINCSTVDININNTLCRMLLNSDLDKIYSQIKDRHFSDVFTFLSSTAKVLQGEYKKSQNMNLQQIREYISKELKDITLVKKSLAYHISACENIISKMGNRFENLQKIEHSMMNCINYRENCNYIESCIAMDSGDTKLSALRLLVLLSITNDGILLDELNLFKTQFVQKYGYKYLNAFNNLKNAGLISEQQSMISSIRSGDVTIGTGILANKVVQALPSLPNKRSSLYNFSQKLKLLPASNNDDDNDLKDPKDMSYVFGGAYIPVVCQLVLNLIKKEMTVEDIEKIVPNSKFKNNDENIVEGVNFTINPDNSYKQSSYFIYFIGGVTYSEIAAFHLLEKLTGSKIYVGASSVTNGNKLIEFCL